MTIEWLLLHLLAYSLIGLCFYAWGYERGFAAGRR